MFSYLTRLLASLKSLATELSTLNYSDYLLRLKIIGGNSRFYIRPDIIIIILLAIFIENAKKITSTIICMQII